MLTTIAIFYWHAECSMFLTFMSVLFCLRSSFSYRLSYLWFKGAVYSLRSCVTLCTTLYIHSFHTYSYYLSCIFIIMFIFTKSYSFNVNFQYRNCYYIITLFLSDHSFKRRVCCFLFSFPVFTFIG